MNVLIPFRHRLGRVPSAGISLLARRITGPSIANGGDVRVIYDSLVMNRVVGRPFRGLRLAAQADPATRGPTWGMGP